MEREVIAVSACLLGVSCKYDGGHNLNLEVIKKLKGKEVIPICPEVFGEMGTPRIPSEIQSEDQIVNKQGKDVTENFKLGLRTTWDLLQKYGCKKVILKDGSPSCGYKTVYDGTFSDKKITGMGFTAKFLQENGIEIIDLNT